MDGNMKLEEVRKEIEEKRKELNGIVIKGLDKEKIVTFSQELDILINKYHLLQLND